MRTSKYISTISYNTDEFLIDMLNDLIRERKISFWAYINHLAEEEEKKAHKHVFMIPCRLIDTFSIEDRSQEIDVDNPDLPPLVCKHFITSTFVDWYLYVLHDKDYLAMRGDERKYHYQKEDIVCSDDDTLTEMILKADYSKYKRNNIFFESVEKGIPFSELVRRGAIPMQQFLQYREAYKLLVNGDFTLNSKVHHYIRNIDDELESNNIVYSKTGEIVPMKKVYYQDVLPFDDV